MIKDGDSGSCTTMVCFFINARRWGSRESLLFNFDDADIIVALFSLLFVAYIRILSQVVPSIKRLSELNFASNYVLVTEFVVDIASSCSSSHTKLPTSSSSSSFSSSSSSSSVTDFTPTELSSWRAAYQSTSIGQKKFVGTGLCFGNHPISIGIVLLYHVVVGIVVHLFRLVDWCRCHPKHNTASSRPPEMTFLQFVRVKQESGQANNLAYAFSISNQGVRIA
jgi:hypothetical protein